MYACIWRTRKASRLVGITVGAVLALSVTATAAAQDRPFAATIEGSVSPGTPHTYALRASAGELIAGRFAVTAPDYIYVIAALIDETGSPVKRAEFEDDGGTPSYLGFVAPRDGSYTIRIEASKYGPTDTWRDRDGPATYKFTTERSMPATRMAGVAYEPTVQIASPRLERLAREVAAKSPGVVERFWAEVEAAGAPLVEAIANSETEILVTFLWRETYETHTVLVVCPGVKCSDSRLNSYMSHLAGTNVWHRTLRLFRGSQFEYQLAPNDKMGDHNYTAQKDPLSHYGASFEYTSTSVLDTPGAPDESWFRREPALRGTVSSHLFSSTLMKGRHGLSIYTPPGYAPSKGPYPLLMLFDGYTYRYSLSATNTLDNLIGAGLIRPTVVCFFENGPDGNRQVDLGVQGAPTTGAAVVTELLPWLREAYAISRDSKDLVIGGYSAGGAAAGIIALMYPQVFGNALVQSAGGPMTPEIALLVFGPSPNANAPKARFYVDSGLYEGVQNARQFRDWLSTQGYEVSYRETATPHGFTHWRATLAEGLITLLAPQTR